MELNIYRLIKNKLLQKNFAVEGRFINFHDSAKNSETFTPQIKALYAIG